MKKRNVLYAIALLLALGSCTEETQQAIESGKQQFVRFTSVVEGTYTRAAGASWSPSDAIGVYMKSNGAELSAGSIVGDGDNVEYFTENGDGNFLPVSTYLSFPEDGSKVDFIAYYPHQQTINNFIYPVDITNQADPETIDLLYADKLEGISERSNALKLSFSHQLARLVLNVKSVAGSSLEGLSISISGVKTKANFLLANGTLNIDANSKGDVAMHMVRGEGLSAEAILLPEGNLNDVKLKFVLSGKSQEIPLSSSLKFEKGRCYTYTINIKNGEAEVDPEAPKYSKWIETPVITKSQIEKSNIKYINHAMPNNAKARNYSLLYDTNLKMAYWVAYPIYEGCVGDFKRKDNWVKDPELDAYLQANFKNAGTMYSRGYNRGHQIPSKDRTGNGDMNATTFYYTNATPQKGNMNSDIWGDLEDAVRGWSTTVDTLYVVTGAMAKTSENDIVEFEVDYSNGKVAVPKYYYKALARKILSTFYTIGFKIANDDKISKEDYMKYAISVEALEQETGFTFFPTLDAQAKKLDKSKWQ